MTTTDLARLRSEYDGLASKATAGPWERLAGDEGRRISCEPLRTLGYSSIVARVESPSNRMHADAALIVWLRNSADALLDAAEASERLRAAFDRLQEFVAATDPALLDAFWFTEHNTPEAIAARNAALATAPEARTEAEGPIAEYDLPDAGFYPDGEGMR